MNSQFEVINIPDIGSIYLDELNILSESLDVSLDVRNERIIYVASAIFESYIEISLEVL